MPAALDQEFLDRINKIYRILLGLSIHFLTANLTNLANLFWVATSFFNREKGRNARKKTWFDYSDLGFRI